MTLRLGKKRLSAALATAIYLHSVRLDHELPVEDAPKWQQVALEGQYDGYGGGEQPFAFDKATFEKIVANFRKHPSYKASAAGVGSSDVVPWDFSHASEYPPVMGDLPVNGAPAQGWVQELEVRTNTEGKSSLWALTRWLPKAKEYIKAGQYKWASVAVNLEAVDAVSGEPIGPVLTSIAMTNSPFIEGMIDLAATRQGVSPGRLLEAAERVRAGNYYYSAARDEDEAACSFRQLFGLPLTAGTPEIKAQLDTLDGMVAGSVPYDESVELDEVVGAVRQIMNLGVLVTAPEVVAKAKEFIDALAVPKTASVGATSSNAGSARDGDQDTMDLIKILAGKLGCKETAEAIVASIDGQVELRKEISIKLGKKDANDAGLLAEVIRLAGDNADLRAKLEAMAAALGVQDPAGAVARLAQLIADSKKLTELMPELESLQADTAAMQEDQMQQDVAAARDAHFDGNEKVDGLLVLEYKELVRENEKAGSKKFTLAREKFFSKYPVQEAGREYLTRDLSGAGSGGGPGRVAATSGAPAAGQGSATRLPGARTTRLKKEEQVPEGAIDITDQPGPNATMKAIAYVKATVPGAKEWDHEQVWTLACENLKSRKYFVRQSTAN